MIVGTGHGRILGGLDFWPKPIEILRNLLKKFSVDSEDFLDGLFDNWCFLIKRICVYIDVDAFLRVLTEVFSFFWLQNWKYRPK